MVMAVQIEPFLWLRCACLEGWDEAFKKMTAICPKMTRETEKWLQSARK